MPLSALFGNPVKFSFFFTICCDCTPNTHLIVSVFFKDIGFILLSVIKYKIVIKITEFCFKSLHAQLLYWEESLEI